MADQDAPKFLLVGPYDPHCGEYTFLAPPLGVWRLAGTLQAQGIDARVFDPNSCGADVAGAFETMLRAAPWDFVGISTTAMTLRYDLALAHQARRALPKAILGAGGMEATFHPERLFQLGPAFDLVVLGEGEHPLLELAARIRAGATDMAGINGTALPVNTGGVVRFHQAALNQAQLRQAIERTPYAQMPYQRYWERLERSTGVAALPYKAERESRLAEIRSVRLITLNYCPMACSFCSSTNFLHEAQGGVARVARLEASECMDMLHRIVQAHPTVRTVIFQDDIFVFTKDQRILALCEAIVQAKRKGELPRDLQFISTNRIDAMTPERLAAMSAAGFRVLGFGIENFSQPVLGEFNKQQIHRHIEPSLRTALDLGITPFLDLILTSPGSLLSDLAENVRQATHWIEAGCEVGIYPYVIPFSGSAMARDARHEPHTVYETRSIPGTDVRWREAIKILPADARTRDAIERIEECFGVRQRALAGRVRHIPSRLRSILWLQAGLDVLADCGETMPQADALLARLDAMLPVAASPPPRRAMRPRASSDSGIVAALA